MAILLATSTFITQIHSNEQLGGSVCYADDPSAFLSTPSDFRIRKIPV